MGTKQLTHTDRKGNARMVDVGNKPVQKRVARAEGFIRLQSETLRLIEENEMKKGDVLKMAEFAGIQAAKRTSELIPLCHTLLITRVEVVTQVRETGIRVETLVQCNGQTGVEMEALTAVNIALLTVYDMCKAVDPSMQMEGIRLISKEKLPLSKEG